MGAETQTRAVFTTVLYRAQAAQLVGGIAHAALDIATEVNNGALFNKYYYSQTPYVSAQSRNGHRRVAQRVRDMMWLQALGDALAMKFRFVPRIKVGKCARQDSLLPCAANSECRSDPTDLCSGGCLCGDGGLFNRCMCADGEMRGRQREKVVKTAGMSTKASQISFDLQIQVCMPTWRTLSLRPPGCACFMLANARRCITVRRTNWCRAVHTNDGLSRT